MGLFARLIAGIRNASGWKLGLIALVGVSGAALASETITNSYDSLGRLIKVARSGTVNSTSTECYTQDPAANRSNVTVTTSGTCTVSDGSATGSAATILVNDASGTEGSPIVFSVSITGPLAGTASVNYSTANGTATSGSDYVAASGSLTFTSSPSTLTISIGGLQDATHEANETFLLNLSSPAGATLAVPQATGTIIDDDPNDCTGVSFSLGAVTSVIEGNALYFPVNKSGNTASNCALTWTISDGTATMNSDYGRAGGVNTGSLSFGSSVSSQLVQVPTFDDNVAESSETVNLTLSAPTSGATIGTPSTIAGTILDNEPGPCGAAAFAVSDASANPGSAVVFTISKPGTSTTGCTVDYATANGSATAPGNYTAKSGTLSFGTGSGSQTVSVATSSGTTTQKYFYLNLSNASNGGVISDSQGVGTINGTAPTNPCQGVTFAVSNGEADPGQPVVFTVTKTGTSTATCSVSYATADGSAVAPTEYTASSGTLTFGTAAGTLTVTVPTKTAASSPFDQFFYLNLSAPTGGATISDSQGNGLIFGTGGDPCPTC